MRRLRFAGQHPGGLDMEFERSRQGTAAQHFEHSAADPTLGIHAVAVMAGPEAVHEQFFTQAHRDRVLGPAEQ
jgi:hypothetical protein